MKTFEKAIFFSAVAVLLGIVGLNFYVQEFVSYDNNVLTGAIVNLDSSKILWSISWIWIIVAILIIGTFFYFWKRKK